MIKSLFIAFAMYSKIPMPQFDWEQDNMKYVFCFFPWVGAVIGALELGWFYLCSVLGIGEMAFVFTATAIPLLVTGGFHADGFMDVTDALCSYQSRERKLEILKDPRTGAFAVIRIILYYLFYIAALSEIKSKCAVMIFTLGFVASRSLSGLLALWCRPAKEGGSLKAVSEAAVKKKVTAVLILYLLLCAGFGLYLNLIIGIVWCVALLLCVMFYRHKVYKEFGGVTGDTAGWFLMLAELTTLIVLALCEVLL